MEKQNSDHINTRERILQIACEVFALKGFRNTTVRDICKRAQVNIAAINYYFSSKEKLYEEVCKYVCGLSSEDADPRFKLDQSKRPEEQLHLFIRALLINILGKDQTNRMDMIMGREIIEPTNALSIVIKDMIRPRFQQLYSIVNTLLGGNTDDEIVRRCCLSITGQCLYYRFARPVVLRLNPQQKFDNTGIEELADHITKFSLNAIKMFTQETSERK
jgi:AcrR family transcriptional regulator